MLILLNRFVNFTLRLLGQQKISLSKRIKDGVKNAVKSKNNFEQTAADIAISKGYDYVVCGHIHKPDIKEMSNEMGTVCYMNSGDWVENLTALEYEQGEWSLYRYQEDSRLQKKQESHNHIEEANYSNKQLFERMLLEFASAE